MTQFLGAFNDNVFKNALIILITYYAADQFHIDSSILVTAAAGIFILPFFLFSALAGQLVEKNEKSKFIRVIKLIECGLMVLAAIGFYLKSVPILMSVLFLMGTQSSFFGPVKYSILPDHLKEKELIGGNALVEAGTFLAILGGTILGGVLILKDGGTTIVSSIVILVAMIGYLSSRHVPIAKSGNPKLKVNYNLIAETWNIIKQTHDEKTVFLSILGISWFWLIGFVFLSQFPIYGKEMICADEEVVTLFLTVFSVGIGLGSLFCNRLLKGKVSGAYVPLGALGMSAFIIAFWLGNPDYNIGCGGDAPMGLVQYLSFKHHWDDLFCLMMIAVFGGIYIVPLYTIMQTRCADSHRSRTVAANNIMNAFFMVMGALITMSMLKIQMTPVEIFLSIGLFNVPVALLIKKLILTK